MDSSLQAYIDKARKKGKSDEQIRGQLVGAGWEAGVVDQALNPDDDLVPPPPPPKNGAPAPVAVVQNYSTRGLEYIIMFIAMGVTAFALGDLLHSLVDAAYGQSDTFYENTYSYASSAIVVALPIFFILFMRLKKAELADSHLLADSSRKKAVQLTLIVTFLIGLFKVITYIYGLMNGTDTSWLGDGETEPAFFNLLHTLVTLVIAGGIFAYYWLDQHRVKE